jgi:hypothetical protein
MTGARRTIVVIAAFRTFNKNSLRASGRRLWVNSRKKKPILDATVQNLDVRATWRSTFVQRRHKHEFISSAYLYGFNTDSILHRVIGHSQWGFLVHPAKCRHRKSYYALTDSFQIRPNLFFFLTMTLLQYVLPTEAQSNQQQGGGRTLKALQADTRYVWHIT